MRRQVKLCLITAWLTAALMVLFIGTNLCVSTDEACFAVDGTRGARDRAPGSIAGGFRRTAEALAIPDGQRPCAVRCRDPGSLKRTLSAIDLADGLRSTRDGARAHC